MIMEFLTHDFVRYPELTNTQMQTMSLQSPHDQISSDFTASVVKVHDGDTVTLSCDFRNFVFPLRLLDIDAPELNEDGGHESKDWLIGQILGEVVDIQINPLKRVGKYGRLLGTIIHKGININLASMMLGYSKPFNSRFESKIMPINSYFMEVTI